MHKIELPKVTIMTPTFNRFNFIYITLKNIIELNYPKDKLEWLIFDDSDDKSDWDKVLDEFRPRLPHTEYFRQFKKHTIGYKRNWLCRKAKHPILLFLDDDDIYHPQTIINRVRPMINNHKIGLVGSCDMLLYFNYDNTYRWQMPKTGVTSNTLENMHEGTMCFRKPFFKKRPFNDNSKYKEGYEWLKGRTDMVMHIPCADVMIMCVHGSNTVPKDIFYTYLKPWNIEYIPNWLKERLWHYNEWFLVDNTKVINTKVV